MNADDPIDEPLRDLLDTLRDEWRDETADRDDREALPPESLEECDEATQRSVAWLREAWRLDVEREELPLPPIAVARAARRRLRSRNGRRTGAAVMVAAAAIAAVLTLRQAPEERPAEPIDTPIATGDPTDVIGSPNPPPANLAESPRRADFGPDRFRSRDDGVELVSGSVRLVLLAPGG